MNITYQKNGILLFLEQHYLIRKPHSFLTLSLQNVKLPFTTPQYPTRSEVLRILRVQSNSRKGNSMSMKDPISFVEEKVVIAG